MLPVSAVSRTLLSYSSPLPRVAALLIWQGWPWACHHARDALSGSSSQAAATVMSQHLGVSSTALVIVHDEFYLSVVRLVFSLSTRG